MNKKRLSIVSIIVLSMIIFSGATAQTKADDKESARVFVQKFYDWYLMVWAGAEKHPSRLATHELAVSQKPEYFDGPLKKAFAKDDNAQNKSGEIVGLDFDPFLRCQDLWGGYQAGNVKKAGGKYLVDIRNIEKGKVKTENADAELRVVVEVVKRNSHWVLTNFIYPAKDGNTNLLDILKALQKDREKKNRVNINISILKLNQKSPFRESRTK